MHSTARLFVALTPSDPVRDALAGLNEELPRTQWTPVSQIHLTIRFIGVQPPEAHEKIVDALATVHVKPFILGVEGIGGFPNRGDWHVLWAGLGNAHPLLHQLRQQVDNALLAAGIQFELRPFVPHLTLSRCREAPASVLKQWAKRHGNFVGPVWPVSSFSLMASEPTPDGARLHRTLRQYALSSLT